MLSAKRLFTFKILLVVATINKWLKLFYAGCKKYNLSEVFDCQISRISEKNRNPTNKPEIDLSKNQLKKYTQKHRKGENLEPKVYLLDNKVEYYKPITIKMETCLKSHGQSGQDIANSTQEMLKEKYPDDKATGYKMCDFRGNWKVTFNKKK